MARFHEGFADKLVVPEGSRDVQVFDDEVRGFGIRKFAPNKEFPKGKASYFVKYNIGRQQRRLTLAPVVRGNLGKIRALATEVLARARLGQDAVAEQRAVAAKVATPTLGDLVPKYLEVRVAGDDHLKPLRRASMRMVRHYLEVTWQPLHKRPIDQITRAEIKAVLDDVARQSGKSTADSASTALSTLFGWALYAGRLEQNPVVGLKSYNGNARRTRVPSEVELAAVWRATDDASDYSRICRLLILTACRRKELGALGWQEVDLERGLIELPGERVKNSTDHLLPLSEPALAILEDTPQERREEGRFIFGKDRSAEGFNGWAAGKFALDKRIAKARGGKPLAAWTVHDIRRSVATHLAELGIAQPHIIEAILNHQSGHKAGIAGTYNSAAYLQEKREALERWAAHVLELVAGRGKRVEVRPKRARELA
jgi:integrase